MFSPSPPLFPGHSHCPVAEHRETGFSTVQERLYQCHMKAGLRWNFLCHSGNSQTDHVIYYSCARKHADSISLNILSHRVDIAL